MYADPLLGGGRKTPIERFIGTLTFQSNRAQHVSVGDEENEDDVIAGMNGALVNKGGLLVLGGAGTGKSFAAQRVAQRDAMWCA